MTRMGTTLRAGRLAHRLSRLEQQPAAEYVPRCYIVRGDEPLPRALRAQDLVVRLPRKCRVLKSGWSSAVLRRLPPA